MAKKSSTKRTAHRVGKRAVVMSVALPTDPKEREKLLFSLLCEMDPKTLNITAALDALSLKTGLKVSSLKRYLGLHQWRIRWKAHWDKKSTAVDLAEVDKGIAAILARRETDNSNVPFTQISSKLKDLAYTVVSTNNEWVKSAAAMMEMYTQKATNVINKWKEHGRLSMISKTDQELVEMYMTKASNYYRMVQDYMKPSALISMLDQLGMKEAIGIVPDGMDPNAFTTAALLKKIEKIFLPEGQKLSDTIGNLANIKDVEFEMVQELKELPDVDARMVKDEDNQVNMDRPDTGTKKKTK